MHDLQQSTFYGQLGSCSSEFYNFLQEFVGSKDYLNTESSDIDAISMAEAKAVAANKSHSEAERRRRKRINGHLDTLRNLVPKNIKGDKASLLTEVVRCIRELKKTTEELVDVTTEEDNPSSSSSMKLLFPGETDELKICYDQSDPGTIKATLCFQDRPQMMTELTRALSSVQAKVVRAEMATVGGRTKALLWVQVSGETAAAGGGGGGDAVVATVRKAVRGVLDKAIMLPRTAGQSLPGNKRPRLYHG